MPSFDVVSKVNLQEVENAVHQSTKEVQTRYDFKGLSARFEWDKKSILLYAPTEDKINAMLDILQTKLIRRQIELQAIKINDVEASAGSAKKQRIDLVQGIDKEVAKKVTKAVKDSGIKVQTQIIGEVVRVSSKSIDSLQETMAMLRVAKIDVPLQFENMRS